MVGNDTKTMNFYSVSGGKIVKSFGGTKPENVETEERINKNGNTVFEQRFSFISGKVVEAYIKSHEEYGDNICLKINDGHEVAELQIKFDSAYGRSFLYKIPNIDFSKELKIIPYSFTDKTTGKNILGLQILDPIEKVPNYYTKDNPNGLPQMKKVIFKGKETWDNSEQIVFLNEKFIIFSNSFSEKKEEEILDEEVMTKEDELDF